MTYTGKMLDGIVVFDGEKPEDGTIVRVETIDTPTDTTTISQRLLKLAGCIEDGPSDASVNLDHYLYGLPKK